MCTLCASTQPWAEDCYLDEFAGSGGELGESDEFSSTPEYTNDQIATQLTHDYWGGSARSFDVSTGDTLYVDITGLTADGQAMALQALDAWSMVSGLKFEQVNSDTAPVNTVVETSDAPSGVNNTYEMNVGDDFTGTLGAPGESDMVAVYLTAGETVTITLSGDGTDPLDDPYLYLLDENGNVLAQNDDANGTDAAITYQATYTGYHYVSAAAFNDGSDGDYRLSVRQNGAVADIVFDDNNPGAYATTSVWDGTIQSAHINISDDWAGGTARTDSYYYQTYVHEIGHALGLGHAGDYNGEATYGVDNDYENDSWQSSVMSYFPQTENTSVDADFAYVVGPQTADILAVQSLYGTPTSANSGDSIYGDNGNTDTFLDGVHDLSNPVSYTVYDTDGIDTFDFSSSSTHQVMDLREEQYSDLDGTKGNVGIARDTVIENGRTGSGNDQITGNDARNELHSGSGQDTVAGGAGNDAIIGGSGDDTLNGDEGADLIEGGTGSNTIYGGSGGDFLIGGDLTLEMLTLMFPSWIPPDEAESLIETDDYMALWSDISDTFELA
ncbi:MAG: M10 family metallopeptidase C-terminal domain-containing protein [Pseudomonadota bacterium]